jgi:hypothetical protein
MTSDESEKKPITLEDRASDGDRLFSPAAARNPVFHIIEQCRINADSAERTR